MAPPHAGRVTLGCQRGKVSAEAGGRYLFTIIGRGLARKRQARTSPESTARLTERRTPEISTARPELRSLPVPRRSQAVQDLPLELCALAPVDQLQTAETGVTTRLTCVPSALASAETLMSWPALLKLRPDRA